MEFEEFKRVRTLLHSCRIYLFGVSLLKDNIPTCVPKPVTCFITWKTIANSGRIKQTELIVVISHRKRIQQLLGVSGIRSDTGRITICRRSEKSAIPIFKLLLRLPGTYVARVVSISPVNEWNV